MYSKTHNPQATLLKLEYNHRAARCLHQQRSRIEQAVRCSVSRQVALLIVAKEMLIAAARSSREGQSLLCHLNKCQYFLNSDFLILMTLTTLGIKDAGCIREPGNYVYETYELNC